MKNLKLTMTSQETQFIFAILAKSELHSIDSLDNFLACVDVLQPVAKEFEKKAQGIVNQIQGINAEKQTLQKLTEMSDEEKKAENKKLDKEISDLQEKFGKIGEQIHSFDFTKETAVSLNGFISHYLQEGTRFGGNKEMREILSVPALKIVGKIMKELSPAVQEVLKDYEDSCEKANGCEDAEG